MNTPKKIEMREIDDNIVSQYSFWKMVLLPLDLLLVSYVWAKKKVWWVLFKKKPKINSIFLDKFGDTMREIRSCPGTGRSLDLIYNYKFGTNRFDDFWLSRRNPHSVRNRFKLVKKEMRDMILATGKKEVRVLEVASGSAMALLEVALELKDKGIEVDTILLDRDQSALEEASELYKAKGIKHQLRTANATSATISEAIGGFSPDIVEVVGLIDYLNDQQIVRLFKRLHGVLPDGGKIITSNVAHNSERLTLHTMLDWPKMIYRPKRRVEKMLKEAGFKVERSYYEPFGIFCIIVAEAQHYKE